MTTKKKPGEMGKVSRSSLAAELKHYMGDRDEKLYAQWRITENTYNEVYGQVKIEILNNLGMTDIAARYKQITGRDIVHHWQTGVSFIGVDIDGNSAAGVMIQERLVYMGVKSPGEPPRFYNKTHSDATKRDYENARSHIMFDSGLTVASALEIVRKFKDGEPIPEFVPPMDKLLGGYPLVEQKAVIESPM